MADASPKQKALSMPVVSSIRSLKGLALWLTLCLILAVVEIPFSLPVAASSTEPSAKPLIRRDLYYNTEGVARTSRAPELTDASYPQLPTGLPSENRLVVWLLAQQQTYWGAFVLGGFFVTVLFEFLSLSVRRTDAAERYRRYGQEVLSLVGAALVIAAIVGCLLLAGLLFLYPDLLTYLMNLFKPFLIAALCLLVLHPLVVWSYWSTWDRMADIGHQWLHLTIGIVGVVLGTVLLLLVDGWASLMMSPAGVDYYGRFLGNYWHLIHTATWNAFNLHRFFGHIVFAAGVITAYAAYHAMTAKTSGDKTYYDKLSLTSMLVMVFALLPMLSEGYWLIREIYAYRQQMGITLLGGLLAWLGVVLASLLGTFFLGINYYLWQRISSAPSGLRYRSSSKYVFGLLALCMAVYVTPHTFMMTPLELLQMGGQQHQVLGNYGVESGKQPAINLMILITIWSLLVWSWTWVGHNGMVRKQKTRMAGLFLAAAGNIIWLGIYGFYIPANVRVGLSLPTAATTFTVVLAVCFTVVYNLRKTRECDGTYEVLIPTRAYYALFLLSFIVTWMMGLGGYRRSALRLYWHVNEIVRDASPWAYTHSVGFTANVISLNALIFWVGFLALFWFVRLMEHSERTLAPSEVRP